MKITGLGPLIGHLKEAATMDDIKEAIKINTVEMSNEMIRNADFTQGYSTGATKRSIVPDILDNGFTGKAGPQTEYAPFLIYGTRFMAAQDFFRPAFYKTQKQFMDDLNRLMK